MRCPICGKTFEQESSSALPFCSHRCRLVDLQHWFDEEYGLDTSDEESRDEPEDERQRPGGE